MSEWLAVFIGGGLGSLLRFVISKAMNPSSISFPWGTFVVNLLACVVLGLGWVWLSRKTTASESFQLLVMIGFCGGFSTFSTFSLETFRLLENGQFGVAFLYVSASIFACLISIWAIIKTFN